MKFMQSIYLPKIGLAFSFLFMLITLFPLATKSQCSDITLGVATTQELCLSSGIITVTLSSVANFTNRKYGIKRTDGGGIYNPPAGQSDDNPFTFVGLSAGTYEITVEGFCDGSTPKTLTGSNVVVGGSYVIPSYSAALTRTSLYCASTGIITFRMEGGSQPYTYQILSGPSNVGQTGTSSTVETTTIVTPGTFAPGIYKVRVTDACGYIMPTQEVIVTAHSRDIATLTDLYAYLYDDNERTDCKRVRIYASASTTSLLHLDQYDIEFAVSFKGGPISTYTKLRQSQFIDLSSVKDIYGQTITIHYKFLCDQTGMQTRTISVVSSLSILLSSVCAVGGYYPTISMNYTNQPACFPVTVTFKNNATSATTTVTVPGRNNVTGTTLLPEGIYTVSYVTADGYAHTTNSAWTIKSPVYSLGNGSPNSCGVFGRSYFYLIANGGSMPIGTRVRLLEGPVGYNSYDVTITSNTTSYYISYPTGSTKYWIPGTYKWEVTDGCSGKVTELTKVIELAHVHSLTNFSIGAPQETCSGLVVKPTATAHYGGTPQAVYFKIIDGPAGHETTIIGAGGSLTLPRPGRYRIAVSANAVSVCNYGLINNNLADIVDYPNEAKFSMSNVITIDYEKVPLAIDVDNSVGYVCPGLGPNTGTIRTFGKNGSTPYYFRVAEEGKGETGPYLAANSSGVFTGMTINKVYDVRIEDACGSATYKAIKVLDLSTAQITSASATTPCEGDPLQLKVVSLDPATYRWTGPNDFTAVGKVVDIPNATLLHSGKYTVEVESDLCPGSRIVDEIEIKVTRRSTPADIKLDDIAICTGTRGTLAASSTTVTNPKFNWYTDAALTTLAPGTSTNTASYTTPVLTANATYYVSVGGDNACPNKANNGMAVAVLVSERPTPSLTGAITVCGGDTQTYTTEAGFSSYTWLISGGVKVSGGGMTDNSVVVKWNNSGGASISVNYLNSKGCSASVSTSKTITIKTLPLPTITVGAITACFGSSGQYTTQSGKYSYFWDVNGGTVTSGQGTAVATIQWTAASVCTVKVRYANANGDCLGTSAARNVTVIPLPTPTVTGEAIACYNDSKAYTTETGMSSYVWVVTGGIITSGNGTRSITIKWDTVGAGKITVTSTTTVGCKGTSAEKSITVHASPTPTITGLDKSCLNDSKEYTTQTGMSGYTWVVTGGIITSGQNTNKVTVKWDTIGTGKLKVAYTNSSGCIDTSAEKSVVVDALPSPTITGNVNVCTKSTGTYSTEAGMAGYIWSVSGGAIKSGGATNTITVEWGSDSTGNISISYTSSNSCMAALPTAKSVTINALPIPTIAGTANVVSGSVQTYTTQAGMSDYTWTITNGTITSGQGTSSVTVRWGTSGVASLSVSYKAVNGCYAASPAKMDMVVEIAKLTLTLSASTAVEDGSPVKATICLPELVVAPAGGVTVNLDSHSLSTVIPADYRLSDGGVSPALLPAIITISQNSRCVEFNVSALGDDWIEGNEQLDIAISSIGFMGDQKTLTISDRTIGDIMVRLEGDAAEPSTDGKFWIGFKEDVKCVNNVEVTYVLSGSAIEGIDYDNLTPHTITIPKGERGVVLITKVKDNYIVEGNRVVEIEIKGATQKP